MATESISMTEQRMSTTQRAQSSHFERKKWLKSRWDEVGELISRDEIWCAQRDQVNAIDRRARELWTRRGERYRLCTLENYETGENADKRRVVAALDRYAENVEANVKAGRSVVLIGPAGTGKDHLLAGLVHCALYAGLEIDWRTGAELWCSMRKAIRDDRESEEVRSLVRPDVLVISDPIPPEAAPSNYERSILYSVIDSRYSHCKPTWVSINATGRKDAAERLGEAVVDRLADDALSAACNWQSYRAGRRWRQENG